MERPLLLLLLAIALVAPSTAYVPDTLTVTFLDVGQGDSILVQAPNGRAMLVDAGESWAAPVQLAGCTTSDASTHVSTFPSFVLATGATVTVHTGTGTNPATDLYWGLGSSIWNNTGDTATLKRPDGGPVSSITRTGR